LTFDDGSDVIARLARSSFNDNAECTEDALTYSFFSEVRLSKLLFLGFVPNTLHQVATLAFVKQRTSIPVPDFHRALFYPFPVQK
jgi:hypothetical protein